MPLSTFSPLRISKSAVITLNGQPNEVFPFFNPIGEREWAEGWDPQFLYPIPAQVEEHMIFKTQSHHGHGEPDYIWTVSKYLPDQAVIEYTLFTPERMWWIAIRCWQGSTTQSTIAEITYTYTGLSDIGNAINERAA